GRTAGRRPRRSRPPPPRGPRQVCGTAWGSPLRHVPLRLGLGVRQELRPEADDDDPLQGGGPPRPVPAPPALAPAAAAAVRLVPPQAAHGLVLATLRAVAPGDDALEDGPDERRPARGQQGEDDVLHRLLAEDPVVLLRGGVDDEPEHRQSLYHDGPVLSAK